MAVTKLCTCTHEFQDKQYGNKQRVHNECNNSKETKEYRCTVCGTKRK
jgi:hypothetical protein